MVAYYKARTPSPYYSEDTHASRTTFAYDQTLQPEPLLAKVTDSAGRSLDFGYERRDFAGLLAKSSALVGASAVVLTHLTGPDGLAVDFDYDADANLIRVAREDDARVETYAYANQQDPYLPADQRHKLVTATDPNGHARHYSYNEATLEVQPGSGPLTILPFRVVEQITDAEGWPMGLANGVGPS